MVKIPVLYLRSCKVTYLYICNGESITRMDDILKKLKYGNQVRIAILNAPENFRKRIEGLLPGVQIDIKINARYLYEFIIAFSSGSSDIEKTGPLCIHNMSNDGKLWMAYPRGAILKNATGNDCDKGWNSLENTGLRRAGRIVIDNDWAALRFRDSRYIKSGK